MLTEFQAAAEVADVLNDIFSVPVSADGLGWIEDWWHKETAGGEVRGDILASDEAEMELDGIRLALRRKRAEIRAMEPAGAVEIGPNVLAEVAGLVSQNLTRLCDPVPPIEEEQPEPQSVAA